MSVGSRGKKIVCKFCATKVAVQIVCKPEFARKLVQIVCRTFDPHLWCRPECPSGSLAGLRVGGKLWKVALVAFERLLLSSVIGELQPCGFASGLVCGTMSSTGRVITADGESKRL